MRSAILRNVRAREDGVHAGTARRVHLAEEHPLDRRARDANRRMIERDDARFVAASPDDGDDARLGRIVEIEERRPGTAHELPDVPVVDVERVRLEPQRVRGRVDPARHPFAVQRGGDEARD